MRQTVITFALSTLALFNNVHAASLPSDLVFENKPIDSLCFFDNENISDKIDLNNCGAAKQKFAIKDQNEHLLKQGFIGYNWQDTAYPESPGGYSYYKFFPTANAQYWIYSVNSGGGSGEFTAIQLVKRITPESLFVKGITGGDRCNGGVTDVSEKSGALTFNVNLTPSDFISLSKLTINNVKPYDDLAACAACCFGKASYTVTPDDLNPKFNQFIIEQNIKLEELPQQGKLQACFNKLFVSNNKFNLTEADIVKLVEQFKEKCIK